MLFNSKFNGRNTIVTPLMGYNIIVLSNNRQLCLCNSHMRAKVSVSIYGTQRTVSGRRAVTTSPVSQYGGKFKTCSYVHYLMQCCSVACTHEMHDYYNLMVAILIAID